MPCRHLKYHGNFLINNMEIECINTKLLARSSMAVKVNLPMFWVQLKTQQRLPGLVWGTNPEDDTKGAHAAPLFRPRRCRRNDHSWKPRIATRNYNRDVNGDGTVTISLWDWDCNVERRLFEIHILEDRFCQLKW